jgi:hypothetical protein
MLTGSVDNREMSHESSQRKSTPADQVKFRLTMLLAISMNASVLAIQDIHHHVAKYTTMPANRRNKNYAFEERAAQR